MKNNFFMVPYGTLYTCQKCPSTCSRRCFRCELEKNLMMGLFYLVVLSCIGSASVSSFLKLSHLETSLLGTRIIVGVIPTVLSDRISSDQKPLQQTC